MPLACDSDPASDLAKLAGRTFEELPAAAVTEAFGVAYAHLRFYDGADLYLTRDGWPFARQLLPSQWFDDRLYMIRGQRLPHSTGTVYRVNTAPTGGRSIDIVVKFSRVGQEVPLVLATELPPHMQIDQFENARFNSPFEEFGLVHELRAGVFGPHGLRVYTHRPLAIYTPAGEHAMWRLGRSESRFRDSVSRFTRDGGEGRFGAIELDIKRDYVLVYSWLKGENAQDCYERGLISKAQFESLAPRVHEELAERGFHVLDNKPKHFILRPDAGASRPLQHRGRLAYGLVDFELLERTEEHEKAYLSGRRTRYYKIQQSRRAPGQRELEHEVYRVRILGVDYVYTRTPNGGRIWAVGNNPELCEFFMPDRWRRTPRLKLSGINEVYKTRTRDNLNLLYRLSRVGERPHVDPFYEHGRRILEAGFNSPFEEVSIAIMMRYAGLPTVLPRAIYRTGHESEKAVYLTDDRRYKSHLSIRQPDDGQPVLSPKHDYFVLWALWRGLDPSAPGTGGPQYGLVDLQQAHDDGLLGDAVFQRVLQRTRRRLNAIGFHDRTVDHTHLLLAIDPTHATCLLDADGDPDVLFSVDAMRALEFKLIDEEQYRHLLQRHRQRLWDSGFDPIELHGNHILLTANPDGVFRRDASGEIETTHCTFNLLRFHGPEAESDTWSI